MFPEKESGEKDGNRGIQKRKERVRELTEGTELSELGKKLLGLEKW